MSCETTEGRVATILYACCGIPLMLFTLDKFGRILYEKFQRLYNAIKRLLWWDTVDNF